MTFPRSSLLLPIVLFGVLGFATSGPPRVEPGLQAAKSGVVLDAQTRQPLMGAYVVVRWLQQSEQISGTLGGQCLYRAIARTDDRGRYAVPVAQFAIGSGRTLTEHTYFWDAYAYAPGYAEVLAAPSLHPRPIGSAVPAIQELEPILMAADHAGPEQRVNELADGLMRFSCEPFAKEPGPVAEQIYAEAYAAACLPEPNRAAGLLARLGDARSPSARPCAQERRASK